jgi:hypothetical protein
MPEQLLSPFLLSDSQARHAPPNVFLALDHFHRFWAALDKKKGTGYFFCALIHVTCAVRSCTHYAAYVCQPATAVRGGRLAATIAAALGLGSTLRRRGRPLKVSEK